MKTVLISLLMAILPFLTQAQNFEKYEQMDNVDQMVITQNMFKLLADIDIKNEDPDVQRYLELVNNLKSIKVLSTEDSTVGQQMQKDVKRYISSSELDELMRVKKDGKNVSFYSKPGSSSGKVSQLLMFLSNKEDGKLHYVVFSITGDIDLNAIARMADDLKVPGAKELKNVKSK